MGGGGSSSNGSNNSWRNKNSLINSANILAKGNSTAVGRAFQKHSARGNSFFKGDQTGSALKNTIQGNNALNIILNNPNAKYIIRETRAYGKILDVRLPDGSGARWTSDGKKFIGFLEPNI